MPRGTTKVLKANDDEIILEVTVGKDYRMTIPAQIRNLIPPEEKRIVTIKKLPP